MLNKTASRQTVKRALCWVTKFGLVIFICLQASLLEYLMRPGTNSNRKVIACNKLR